MASHPLGVEAPLSTPEQVRRQEKRQQTAIGDDGPRSDGNEKSLVGNTPAADSNGESPSISYYYLTFDTRLPLPPIDQPTVQHLPQCPDLTPYRSPLAWSGGRKSVHLVFACISTFLTAYTAGAYSPPAGIMADDLDTTRLVVLTGITTFCLGFALAPMAMAPISEIWGRYPVMAVSGIVFAIFQVVASVMPHIAGVIVARFFIGFGASVFSAITGGVIADLWEKEERNTPMALFSGAVLAGTGAGPLVSAALIDTLNRSYTSWKWTFWHQAILDGALMVFFFLFFKESRGSVLLTRRAGKLNKWYEQLEAAGVDGVWIPPSDTPMAEAVDNSTNEPMVSDRPTGNQPYGGQVQRIRWVVKASEQRASVGQIVLKSIRRPFYLLFTEPVIFSFSLWAAFSWGVLYLSFSVVPFLYDTDLNRSSRVYVAMMAASAVATAVGILQERLLKHPQWRVHRDGTPYSNSRFWAFMRKHFPAEAPEARLYFACITAMLQPIGLFGAFMGPRSHDGYAEAIGLGFATWGIYSVYLANFNYLADTYHIYASSALAAQSFCRNVLGGSFPLITRALFGNLGLRGAGGLLGGIAVVLTVIPWILVFFGETIRARSKVAISLQK